MGIFIPPRANILRLASTSLTECIFFAIIEKRSLTTYPVFPRRGDEGETKNPSPPFVRGHKEQAMNLNSVVGIVRSYRNPYVVKRVQKLLSFMNLVLVVVNEAEDKGSTRAWLSEAGLLRDPRVRVLGMQEGYSWSGALNRALAAIDKINADRMANGEEAYEFCFPVSVEANFEAGHLRAMLAPFEDGAVGVAGTSFRGLLHGNEISLGTSYRHPRNTGMVIRLGVFLNRFVRDFDSACDDFGGMEDLDFITRMLAFTRYRYEMLDLKVALVVGVNYNQTEKEKREHSAMSKIAHARREQSVLWLEAWKKMGIEGI
jgi:hypothetical protein